jgi:hypothetical protein
MGRGKAQHNLDLIEEAYRILEAIQPCSVRAVCYQLFIRHQIDSMARHNTNRVSAQLVDAREQGRIPWHWIVDETREAERAPTWKNPAAFTQAASRSYRRDNWDLQPMRVEVWSEKGTVRGTLAPILHKFGVTFRVMHGNTSATVVRDVVEEHLAGQKPFLALYVGDHDPSGMCMSEKDLPNRLSRYWEQLCFEKEVTFWEPGALPPPVVQRIALTREDGEAIPEAASFSAHDKRKDPNYRWYRDQYGDRCWELDAMNPNDLRQRVERAIRAQIKWKPWRRCLKAEAAEKASLKLVMKNWATGKVFAG